MWHLGGHDSVRGRELIRVRHRAPSTGNTLQIKSADNTCEYVCTHIAPYSLQSSLTLIIFPTWSLLATLWGRLLPDEKTQERLGHLPKSRALKQLSLLTQPMRFLSLLLRSPAPPLAKCVPLGPLQGCLGARKGVWVTENWQVCFVSHTWGSPGMLSDCFCPRY